MRSQTLCYITWRIIPVRKVGSPGFRSHERPLGRVLLDPYYFWLKQILGCCKGSKGRGAICGKISRWSFTATVGCTELHRSQHLFWWGSWVSLEVRGALLHRVPQHLEGERGFATIQLSQWDVDGLCAWTSCEGTGDGDGSHLCQSLHHHPHLHDHGSQVSHGAHKPS